MKEIKIKTEYITLGQFLKFASITSSGGETKVFLSEYEILVNDVEENRRGKKLRVNDIVKVEDFGTFKIV